MTILITLTTAGSDSGPFNLYSDVDGFTSAFEVGVAKIDLLAGYSSSLVPELTTIIRVMSNNPLCTNYIDLELYPPTTTTTTTLVTPLDFVLTSSCSGINATLSMSAYTGGTGPYESGNNYFTSEAAALANTSWIGPPSGSFAIGIGSTPGTYWMVIRDSLGTLKAKDIFVDCTV